MVRQYVDGARVVTWYLKSACVFHAGIKCVWIEGDGALGVVNRRSSAVTRAYVHPASAEVPVFQRT